MATEETTESKIADDQLLEWGDTPLKSEDRVTEDTEVDDEEVDEIEETEESEEESDDENDEQEEVEEFEPPVVDDSEDPGEYVPADYSFTVEIEGKTHKIGTPEEATEFADEHAEEMTAKEILKFMRQSSKMEDRLEKDKDDHEKRKADYDTKKAASDEQSSSITNIANEINYLIGKDKLPKVAAKYANADWSDPEVAKQPGVKEQVELLTYMRKENDARTKAGLAPLTSALDAFNAMELDRRNSTEVDEEQEKTKARKQAGSRIAGTSPKPVNVAPKGIAVGRALGSLSDLDSFN